MEWRPIYGLKNYEASDEGDIRNVLTGKILSSKGNVLCIPTKYCEDIAVSPRQREFLRGSYSTLKVTRGRLCCLAFHGRPEWHNFSVGFKDGDSNNCFEDNLEWRTGRNKEWRSPHD